MMHLTTKKLTNSGTTKLPKEADKQLMDSNDAPLVSREKMHSIQWLE